MRLKATGECGAVALYCIDSTNDYCWHKFTDRCATSSLPYGNAQLACADGQ